MCLGSLREYPFFHPYPSRPPSLPLQHSFSFPFFLSPRPLPRPSLPSPRAPPTGEKWAVIKCSTGTIKRQRQRFFINVSHLLAYYIPSALSQFSRHLHPLHHHHLHLRHLHYRLLPPLTRVWRRGSTLRCHTGGGIMVYFARSKGGTTPPVCPGLASIRRTLELDGRC